MLLGLAFILSRLAHNVLKCPKECHRITLLDACLYSLLDARGGYQRSEEFLNISSSLV